MVPIQHPSMRVKFGDTVSHNRWCQLGGKNVYWLLGSLFHRCFSELLVEALLLRLEQRLITYDDFKRGPIDGEGSSCVDSDHGGDGGAHEQYPRTVLETRCAQCQCQWTHSNPFGRTLPSSMITVAPRGSCYHVPIYLLCVA